MVMGVSEVSQFDDNVMQEILSRLPAKALGRFKTASRRWHDLISDPFFKATQARRSIGNILGILSITTDPKGGMLVYVPLDSNHHEAPDTSLGLQTPRISLKATCNGLIFCKLSHPDLFILSNPTTRAVHYLPYLATPTRVARFGLAFDPAVSPTNCKVVAIERMVQQGSEDYCQFTIYSRDVGAWRVSHETLPCTIRVLFDSVASVFFNGALHWLREWGDIVAFNVEHEKSYTIPLPEDLPHVSIAGYSCVWLGLARGCMTLVKFRNGEILVWVLEDYKRGRWELKQRVRTEATSECYWKSVPLWYDGEKCVLFTWERRRGERGLAVYRMEGKEWEKFRRLEGWMDGCRHFFPYVNHMLG